MIYLNDLLLELDDGAQVKETGDGYMTAIPRVARTGIQLYRGSELGRTDKGIVKIYRDEKEVFDKASLASFAGKPFTDNHPPQMVTAKNWKRYSAGDAGDEILRDGEFIRIPMMLRDAATIAKVKAGKVELSVGYGCEIDWTAGTTPSGEAYDGRQTTIRANHIAVVDAARGGKKLAIGDDGQEICHPLYRADGEAFVEVQPQKDSETMTLKTIVVDGITCEMTDTAVQVVQRALDAAKSNFEAFKKTSEEEQKKAKDALDAAQAANVKLTTESAAKDAKITTLEKQVADSAITPAKLDEMVKDRAIVAEKAKSLLPTVIVDGKSVDEIMKQVVDAKIGEAAKAWPADHVKISFDTMTAGVQIADASGVQRAGRAFSVPLVGDAAAQKTAMYAKADKELSDSWKNPGGQA